MIWKLSVPNVVQCCSRVDAAIQTEFAPDGGFGLSAECNIHSGQLLRVNRRAGRTIRPGYYSHSWRAILSYHSVIVHVGSEPNESAKDGVVREDRCGFIISASTILEQDNGCLLANVRHQACQGLMRLMALHAYYDYR